MLRIAALVAPVALLWQCFACSALPSFSSELSDRSSMVATQREMSVGEKFDERPKVLEFYANWCEPCKQMRPTIDALKERYGNMIEWVSCDVDDPANSALANQYEICPIPALVFLNSRQEVVSYAVGCCPGREEEILERQIEKIVPKPVIGAGIGAKASPVISSCRGRRRSVLPGKTVALTQLKSGAKR